MPGQKPEQMHVKDDMQAKHDPAQRAERSPEGPLMDDPVFSLKETIRLQGMKWLQDRGLQYESSSDDGNYLFLRSRRK